MEVITESEDSVAVLTPSYSPAENPRESDLGPLRVAVKALLERNVRKVAIDLRNVDYLGSADIAALVASARTIHTNSGLMVICGCGLRLAETLGVVQLLGILPVRFTRNLAVSALRKVQPGRDSSSDLVKGNPTMEAFRDWWHEVVQAQTREVRITPSAVELMAEPEQDYDAVDSSSVIRPGLANYLAEGSAGDDTPPEEAMAAVRPGLNDWAAAQETLKSAQRLCAVHGVRFTPDMTFREFMGRLAESMGRGEEERVGRDGPAFARGYGAARGTEGTEQ
jgi:anti-anti-sigma factor